MSNMYRKSIKKHCSSPQSKASLESKGSLHFSQLACVSNNYKTRTKSIVPLQKRAVIKLNVIIRIKPECSDLQLVVFLILQVL